MTIPGNHDIPHTLLRLTWPWQEFERLWETTEPIYRSDTLVVAGLNSVRLGGTSRSAAGRVVCGRDMFAGIPTSTFRIVTALPLLGALAIAEETVWRSGTVLAGLSRPAPT